MTLDELQKLFEDEHTFQHKSHLTKKDLEALKQLAEDAQKAERNTSSALYKQYSAALTLINLNLALQQQNSKMYADIGKDGKISVSLLQSPRNDGSARSSTPSLKKIFETEKKGNTTTIRVTKDPTDLNAPTDKEVAEAIVNYCKAEQKPSAKHVFILITPDNDPSLGLIGEELKKACQKEGFTFFRQTETEIKQMDAKTGKDLDNYIENIVVREKGLEKPEEAELTISKAPKPRLPGQPQTV